MTATSTMRLPAHYLVVFAAAFVLTAATSAATKDTFDTTLEKLVQDATVAIQDSGKKKIAVLDFATIEGTTSTFGKYLAEQISVSLVLARKDFTVVDRSNFKSILSEHHLTEEGLVKPENAKRLGEFSGVDALLIGTVTSVATGHIITIKLVSTDKAEVVGAAKSKLPLSDDFDNIVQPGKPTPQSTPNKPANPERSSSRKEFRSEYVSATFKKLQVLNSGEIVVMLNLAKRSQSLQVTPTLSGYPPVSYFVYSKAEAEKQRLEELRATPTVLRASTGEDYQLNDLKGIGLRNFSWQTTGSGIGGEDQPATLTLRFTPTEHRRTAITASTTFTLDCKLDLVVREGSQGVYENRGAVDIHFEDLR